MNKLKLFLGVGCSILVLIPIYVLVRLWFFNDAFPGSLEWSETFSNDHFQVVMDGYREEFEFFGIIQGMYFSTSVIDPETGVKYRIYQVRGDDCIWPGQLKREGYLMVDFLSDNTVFLKFASHITVFQIEDSTRKNDGQITWNECFPANTLVKETQVAGLGTYRLYDLNKQDHWELTD